MFYKNSRFFLYDKLDFKFLIEYYKCYLADFNLKILKALQIAYCSLTETEIP